MAALTKLDIQITDVGNSYLNVLSKEKCYKLAGKEFGNDERKIVKTVRVFTVSKVGGLNGIHI